jgi:hypothetical protein
LLAPNVQFLLVGLFVEVSVNATARGEIHEVTFTVKVATGEDVPAGVMVK